MQSEPHDWTVPAPLRALLWWPPVAFVVAMLEPTAAAGKIALAGAVLTLLGVLVSTIGRALARRLAASDAPRVTSLRRTTADAVTPVVIEQRVA